VLALARWTPRGLAYVSTGRRAFEIPARLTDRGVTFGTPVEVFDADNTVSGDFSIASDRIVVIRPPESTQEPPVLITHWPSLRR
jgi:hypothetical protein